MSECEITNVVLQCLNPVYIDSAQGPPPPTPDSP